MCYRVRRSPRRSKRRVVFFLSPLSHHLWFACEMKKTPQILSPGGLFHFVETGSEIFVSYDSKNLGHLREGDRISIMAKIFLRYAAMNSGKSTNLIQVAYNYEERGQHVLVIKPAIDTKGEGIVSRLGAARDIDLAVTPEMNLEERLLDEITKREQGIDCILVDEAQFLKREQVNALFKMAVVHNVPVIAYGLRTDFQGNAFEGSARLLEIAHSIEELKTICRCGRKAIFNGRKINGVFISQGSQVAIDGEGVEYESLCGSCYLEKVGDI